MEILVESDQLTTLGRTLKATQKNFPKGHWYITNVMSTADTEYYPLVFLTSADDAILYTNHYIGGEHDCILIEEQADTEWLGMHVRADLAAGDRVELEVQ